MAAIRSVSTSSGLASMAAVAKSRSRENRPAAGPQFAQRGAALERESVEDAFVGQFAQQQVLGDVDDGGLAALGSGVGRGVAGDVAGLDI